MTERSWRENLPDLRQMAIWVLEKGVKKRSREQVQRFVLSTAGADIELQIGRHVSDELARCQLRIRDVHAYWKGALGYMLPERLIIPPGELVAFGETEAQSYDSFTHRPFYFDAVARLDKARKTKKASPYTNQHDLIYFAYWYLLYGDLVGDHMFKYPVDPDRIFADKMEAIYDQHSVPYTYLNNPHDKFKTDFVLAKLASVEEPSDEV